MGKKREFKSVEEELTYLRRQLAGMKGQNTLLVQQREDLNRCIDGMRDEVTRQEKVVNGLESQVSRLTLSLKDARSTIAELSDKLAPLEANVEYYNNLSWIAKMFTFHIP